MSAQELRKAIDANDAPAINRRMDQLANAQHAAAASLYQQASADTSSGADGPGRTPPPGAEGGGPTRPRGDGEVIDAEVVDEGKP
jgi:hypothetical protein